jgi:hypothetical protein
MLKNLNDYVKLYKGFIDPTICEHTVAQMDNIKWNGHTFLDYKNGVEKPLSGENELEMSMDTISTTPILMQTCWEALNQYIVKDFNFPWHNGWSGFTNIKFNKYNENTEMAEHCDHIHSMVPGHTIGIPTLTIVGLLNDDFEGGNFVMFGDEKIDLEKGDVLVFPSNFLYPHRVERITKGTRYTFISWSW